MNELQQEELQQLTSAPWLSWNPGERVLMDHGFENVSANDSGCVYTFNKELHRRSMLHNLSIMQRQKVLTDVEIESNDGEVQYFHSEILSAASEHFEKLFCSSAFVLKKCSLQAPKYSSAVFNNLVNFIYGTPEKPIYDEDNWDEVMDFASEYNLTEMATGEVMHLDAFWSRLQQLFFNRQGCSIWLAGDDNKEMSAHSTILSAASPGFLLWITKIKQEKQGNRLPLRGMRSDFIWAIVNYIYCGFLSINVENVKGILLASLSLRIPSVINVCCHFLKTTNTPQTAVDTFNFVKVLNTKLLANNHPQVAYTTELLDSCDNYISENLDEVVQTGTLKNIQSAEDIIKIIKRNGLQDSRDLKLLVSAIVHWSNVDTEQRLMPTLSVMACVHSLVEGRNLDA